MESKDELSLLLPPCNADADSPENVYLFDDRIFLRMWGDWQMIDSTLHLMVIQMRWRRVRVLLPQHLFSIVGG